MITRSSRSLTVHPPELGLLVTALFLGGLVADGTLRYALFGLAWLVVVVVCVEILPAVVALMVSGAAVVGLFGVNPEGFLAFIGLTLAGVGALIGAGAVVVGCAGFLRYLWRQLRVPNFVAARRRRALILLTPSSNFPTQIGKRRLPSLNQYIVSLAVRRLPAAMSDDECERWEEEMRGDVEGTFLLFRTIYALSIWLRGAPAMPDGTPDAPQNKPTRG